MKIVFLESNTTGTGELLILKALAKGFQPIFITNDPEKYTFLPIKNIELLVLDTRNKQVIFDSLSKEKNIIGIYSSSESYIETASWLAEKMGLPGSNVDSVKICRNKYSLYQALVGSEVNVPKTYSVCDLNGLENIFNEIVCPVIIKPNSGTGSIGVKLCKTRQECFEHIKLLLENAHPNVLIQEYIDAPEFSVEVCSFGGDHHIIGITKKYIGKLPYFLETGHDFPAVLSVDDEKHIKQSVAKLLSKLSFDFGFSHVELKIRNGKVIIIEVNPRLAGGMIPILIEKSTGADLLDCLLELYANRQFTLSMNFQKYVSIRHLIPSGSGKIVRMDFNDSISVDEVKMFKKEGDIFVRQNDFRDRVAYIIASDVDMECCKDKANKGLQNFNIVFENLESNLI